MTTRITLATVRSLPVGAIAWDSGVSGFYVRRQRSEARTYGLFYRAGTRQRWLKIGRHGAPWTPDTARDEARRILGEVASGADPAAEKRDARNAMTVADLCDLYLADAEAGRVLVRNGQPKRSGTLREDRSRIERHLKPLLGNLAVRAVTKQDIERMMHAIAEGETAQDRKTKPRGVSRVRGGRGIATRTVGMTGAIFSYATEHQMRPDNPCTRIRKFAENKRERRLAEAEYPLLGAALQGAVGAGIWPPAASCARFLALTGWRSGEALALRWQDLDLGRRTALLPDTKTGRSMRPLSHAACELLHAMPRIGTGALVFPASRGEGPMTGFKKFFRRIVAGAGLPADITPHVLRHSFASLAADLGYGDATIASMIGHKRAGITARYTHSADAVLLAAADAVATRTAELLGDAAPAGEVVELRRA